jgi:hypothetical protein
MNEWFSPPENYQDPNEEIIWKRPKYDPWMDEPAPPVDETYLRGRQPSDDQQFIDASAVPFVGRNKNNEGDNVLYYGDKGFLLLPPKPDTRSETMKQLDIQMDIFTQRVANLERYKAEQALKRQENEELRKALQLREKIRQEVIRNLKPNEWNDRNLEKYLNPNDYSTGFPRDLEGSLDSKFYAPTDWENYKKDISEV